MRNYLRPIGRLRLNVKQLRRKWILNIMVVGLTVILMIQTLPLRAQSGYFGYMPAVKSRIIAEIDPNSIHCRWPHTLGATTHLYYKWGSNLIADYVTAYEAALSDWNAAAIKLHFDESPIVDITLDTENVPNGPGGHADQDCTGTTTHSYKVFLNVANYSGSTANQRRALAGHEVGHSLSVWHLPGRDFISLMGYNPDNNAYYKPQQIDVDWVNQFYQ